MFFKIRLFPQNLEKTIEESQLKITKIARLKRTIPRFVDFVTGNSEQLSKIFKDVEQLYRHPGYVLQQCAFANNLTHFSKIIENPAVTETDLCYPEEKTGNNPIMIAAKLRHKDLVSSILRSNKFEGCENSFLESIIHYRNASGDTLLHTVALQGKKRKMSPARDRRPARARLMPRLATIVELISAVLL